VLLSPLPLPRLLYQSQHRLDCLAFVLHLLLDVVPDGASSTTIALLLLYQSRCWTFHCCCCCYCCCYCCCFFGGRHNCSSCSDYRRRSRRFGCRYFSWSDCYCSFASHERKSIIASSAAAGRILALSHSSSSSSSPPPLCEATFYGHSCTRSESSLL